MPHTAYCVQPSKVLTAGEGSEEKMTFSLVVTVTLWSNAATDLYSSPFNNNVRAPGQRGQQARNMGVDAYRPQQRLPLSAGGR